MGFNLGFKGLMQIPIKHLLTNFPMFNVITGPISANHEQ